MSTTLHPAISRLRSALKEEYFTSGTCKVPVEHCDLYYRPSATSLADLNLAKASDEELAKLIASCDAAPFGRGAQTIMDEGYRKALKLELSQFSMPFDLASTNILQRIQRDLFTSNTALHRFIRAEPYKLNIYDKGSFFKAHKDTPRANNMFGSLVIVFPTPHEGGTLVLSKDGESGEQWSFDTPKLLAEATPGAPEIAFVAFYSDVTHEVLPVASGARVTLTFNLFFDDIVETNASSENLMKHDTVKDAVQELIDDPEVFPEGGILGFGLAHQYALKRTSDGLGYQLSELIGYLKGSDALVYKVCRDLGLDVTLKTYYISNEDREYMGSNFIADQDQIDDDSELYEGLTRMRRMEAREVALPWFGLQL